MGSASPQGYLSGVSNLEAPKRPKISLPLYSSPLGMGSGGGVEVIRLWHCVHGGGCLDLLSGASQSRWELTHRVTAAGCN